MTGKHYLRGRGREEYLPGTHNVYPKGPPPHRKGVRDTHRTMLALSSLRADAGVLSSSKSSDPTVPAIDVIGARSDC